MYQGIWSFGVTKEEADAIGKSISRDIENDKGQYEEEALEEELVEDLCA